MIESGVADSKRSPRNQYRARKIDKNKNKHIYVPNQAISKFLDTIQTFHINEKVNTPVGMKASEKSRIVMN
jgi:hypothetical protein